MKYKIQTSYCWYDAYGETKIVKMYFINYVPFTFDEIDSVAAEDPEVIIQANGNKLYTDTELYQCSTYLAEEECCPLLYDLTELIENPNELPVD
tara:strand:+ start:643 stop:924 length:282 start_codon:yes stop_codon:yes gene_type:complete